MNKKLISVLLAVAMVLALAACGGGTTTESKAPESTSKGKIAYIVGNLGDKSFSDSGEAGMNILRSEGWEVRTIETQNNEAKYEDYIRDALDQGYTYLVGSSTYGDIMMNLASEYPDRYFLGFDEMHDESELPDNCSFIFYKQNEGSYLVGMMAAGMTKSGTVAVNVGMENPVIGDFVTGFIQGVKDYNPSVKVVEAACGSWSDPAAMKTLCLDQARNNGADVFFQVAGGSGDGLFEAAMETGSWAIGVDSDQHQAYVDSANPEKANVILTSMLKEVGNSFVSFFHSVEAGEDVWGKTVTLGLAQDSVGYVDNDFFKANVPETIRNDMAAVADKVKSGALTIKSYYDFANDGEYVAYVNDARN